MATVVGLVFALLSFVLFVAALIGLVKPSVICRTGTPSRMKAFGFPLLASIGCFVVVGIVAHVDGPAALPTETARQEATATPEVLPVSEMTITEYETLCGKVPDDIYKTRCKGKKVVWETFINEIEGVRKFEVQSALVDGRAFDVILQKDYDWQGDLGGYKGKKLKLIAEIDAPAGYAHDLKNAQIVEFLDYTPEEQQTMTAIQAKKAEEAEKTARDSRATVAYRACTEALKSVAKFKSKVDCPWIPDFRYTEKPDGYRISGKCELMNGFGNMVPHTFLCEYKDGAVTDIKASPGG